MQVHPTTSASGSYALRFEHPVIAGAAVGGWLNREEDQVAIAPVEVGSGLQACRVSGVCGSAFFYSRKPWLYKFLSIVSDLYVEVSVEDGRWFI